MYIIKIGGSVLTDKSKPYSFREGVVKEIAKTLRGFKGIIVHGVGSFGHPLALKYRLWEGVDGKCFEWAHTRLSVLSLHMKFLESLISEGIPAVTFGVANIRGYEGWYKATLEAFISMGFVPVLHGDGVIDREKGLRVLSGDDIAAEITNILKEKIEGVIFCVDVDGIYSDDPKRVPNATLLKEISREEFLKVAKRGSDFSGGMVKKAESILRIPREIPVYIINGLKPDNILKILDGKNPGTLIR